LKTSRLSKYVRTSLFIVLATIPQLLSALELWEPKEFIGSFLGDIGLAWEVYVMLGIFFAVFLCLIKEWLPPDVTMLLGAGTLVVLGIIEPGHFLQGFSQPVIFILAMLFIIAKSVEQNGLLNSFSRRIISKNSSMAWMLVKMMLPLSFLSAFLNNTPIVLMLTPFVRRQALKMNISPSKFLIPLSFATIFGGTCTLIGTSGNLIIDGMLVQLSGGKVSLGFFELAKLGVPIVILGISYMAIWGYRKLPSRVDATSDVVQKSKDFVAEFVISKTCVLVGKTVQDAGEEFFEGERVVEIFRGTQIIDSPEPCEIIYAEDHLVFAGDIGHIQQLHKIEGMQSIAGASFNLDEHSSHFSEAIVSTTSSLIGKTLIKSDFRSAYGATVLAIYRQGNRIRGRIGNTALQAGDLLIILSGSDNWSQDSHYTNDFYFLRFNEKLPLLNPWKAFLLTFFLVVMVISIMMGFGMIKATLCMVGICFVTKSISIREARKSVRWNLLILIGSAFAFAHALGITGVAKLFAQTMLPIFGHNPHTFIAGLFIITLLITEVITNNAAALLVFPIALETMRLSGYVGSHSLKAVAVTVALGASCSFLTPIGYQTNTIVYGPGGYKFTDYFKVGWPLTCLVVLLVSFLVPKIWPMTQA
jgi:di/tricarboxylate transporter